MAVNFNSPLYNGALEQLMGQNAALSSLYSSRAAQNANADAAEGGAAGDSVELSDATPKQIAAQLFSDAMATANKITSGQSLSEAELARMKTDPSFASTAALFAFKSATGNGLLDALDGGKSPSSSLSDLVAQVTGKWPEDTSTPSADDLAATIKRLTQRLSGADGTDAESLEAARRELSDLFRRFDASAIAEALAAAGAA